MLDILKIILETEMFQTRIIKLKINDTFYLKVTAKSHLYPGYKHNKGDHVQSPFSKGLDQPDTKEGKN